MTRFLDNVIDVNRYPLPEIEENTKANRKIGLGVMGFADMLIKLGIPYNSKKALNLAEKVMSFIQDESKKASQKLAEERGVFPNFKKSLWDKKGIRLRNATTTTIAPTGSISMIADCSSGIEPLFSLVYYKEVLGGEKLLYTNSEFEKIARERGFYSEKLIKQIAENNGSCQEIPDVPDEVKKLFTTALDISYRDHIKMQAVFQRYTDNAVSKTINLPNQATKNEIKDAFILAYKLGCKGITVYRDKSREEQVIRAVEEKKKKPLTPRPRAKVTYGMTREVRTGCGDLYVTINEDERGEPFEVFAQLGKCVTGETFLLTPHGFRTVQEVVDEHDLKTIPAGEFVPVNIQIYNTYGIVETSHFYQGGRQKTRKITTQRGYQIEGSLEHPILTISEKGEIKFKRLIEISEGDYVVIQRGTDVWGDRTDLSDFVPSYLKKVQDRFVRCKICGVRCRNLSPHLRKHKITKEEYLKTYGPPITSTSYKKNVGNARLKLNNKSVSYPTMMTEDLALLLGYIIGEGTTTEKERVRFSKLYSKDREHIYGLFQKLFPGIKVNQYSRKKGDYEIWNKTFREFLQYLGIDNTRSQEKTVPEKILYAPKNIVCAFLRGLFEAEASINKKNKLIEITMASKTLIFQVHLILLNIGILSTKSWKWNKKYKKEYHRLTITGRRNLILFRDNIGFSSHHKQKSLEEIICSKQETHAGLDIIPHINEKAIQLRRIHRRMGLQSKYKVSSFNFAYKLAPNRRSETLSYHQLGNILKVYSKARNIELYRQLLKIYESKFYFAPVVKIEESEKDVYDFTIPKGHTFFANGFINHNSGGCAASQTEAIGRLASLALRSGIPWFLIVKQLKGISCDRPWGLGKNRILSCADAVAKAIELYIEEKMGWIKRY